MSLLTLAFACLSPKPSPTGLDPSEPSSAETDEDSPEEIPSLTDSDSTAPPEETGTPCVPQVGAILFDLGETLVTEQGDLFYLRPDTVETVRALQDLGLPLGIVTNTYPGWDEQDLRDLLANPEMLDEFDIVLMSSQASSPPKPDAAIFVEAHALLSAVVPSAPPIERTAFVTEETGDLADRASQPTEGARAAGLVGVLLSDTPSDLADYTVSALSEIPGAPWLGCAR
jgi:hypothetical protein